MVPRLVRLGASAAVVACVALAAFGGAAARAAGSIKVPCSGAGGGAAGLVAAIDAANASGGGKIDLAGGCTYSLTAPLEDGTLTVRMNME